MYDLRHAIYGLDSMAPWMTVYTVFNAYIRVARRVKRVNSEFQSSRDVRFATCDLRIEKLGHMDNRIYGLQSVYTGCAPRKARKL